MRLTLPSFCLLTLCLVYTSQAQNVNTLQTLNTATDCFAQGLEYCSACENDIYKCYECMTGYVLKDDLSGCDSCGSYCAECTSINGVITCTKCLDGYLLDSGSCSSCSTGCQECYTDTADNNAIKCKVCYDGYVLNYLGECKACSLIAGCSTCTPSNTTSTGVTCTQCLSGYYATDTGCSSCISNCKTCSDGTTCSECYSTHNLNDDSTSCLPCQANCQTCVAGASATNPSYAKCDACNDFFYVDSEGYCTACTSQCLQCDASTSLCNEGQCNTGYYLTSSQTCSGCPYQCASCVNSTACTTCNERFIVKSTSDVTCDACPDNCQTCTYIEAGSGICGTCNTGYYKDAAGHCQNCPSNCDACTDGSTCTTCSSGYVLKDTNDCTAYVGCNTPYYNATTSTVYCLCSDETEPDATTEQTNQYLGVCPSGVGCATSYYYDSATFGCTACPDGCYYCNSSMCITCQSGYRMDSNGDCQACTSPCKTCSTASDGTEQCDSCSFGYKLESDNTCSACTVANCAVCDSSTSDCTSCSSGYNLDNNVCVSTACTVANCAACASDPATCTDCASGYGLKSDNTCGECPLGCDTCSEDTANNNVMKCTACLSSYAINSVSCAYCGLNCKTCTQSQGSVTCVECDPGYTVDTDGTCKICPSHCTDCSLTACNTCEDGYGVSSDRTGCTACTTLTGVTSCATCTDASAGGKCTSCTATKILAEDQSYCYDAIANCLRPEDHTWDCTACSDPDRVVGIDEYRGKCVYRCYVCGSSDDTNKLNFTMCNGNGNTYNETVECLYDCVTSIELVNGEWAFAYRGCGANGTCAAPLQTTCVQIAEGSKTCTQCCDSDKCNDKVISDDAAALSGALYVLISSVILSRFL